MTDRYSYEFHHNPAFATIHFSFRVKHMSESNDLKNKLEEINGVEDVKLEGYKIRIERGAVFAFDEICEQVLEIVGKHFCINEWVCIQAYPMKLEIE